MSYSEKAYLNEDERKKQEKSEKERKKEQETILKMEQKKEKLRGEEQASKDLQKLKDLLERHIIEDSLVEKVISGTEIDHDEIENIFEKIDEIENIDQIDDYIPQNMRITKEEYMQATHDDAALIRVMGKIERSLGVLAQNGSMETGGSMNLFSGFLTMLDKNLITIQEHHIDMKDSLSSSNVKPKGIWQTLKDSFSK